jgi:hypothetical protein
VASPAPTEEGRRAGVENGQHDPSVAIGARHIDDDVGFIVPVGSPLARAGDSAGLDAGRAGLEVVFVGDGGEGAEEEIGGVSHHGTPSRRDLVLGKEFIEFAEGVVDGDGVAEFLNVTDEDGGEIGLFEFFLAVDSVLAA